MEKNVHRSIFLDARYIWAGYYCFKIAKNVIEKQKILIFIYNVTGSVSSLSTVNCGSC